MLSDLAIKAAKPKGKQYRLTDEKGLYLLIRGSGSKLWRFDYRFEGMRKTLAIGPYPDVSLATARQERSKAREMLQKGISPSKDKAKKKNEALERVKNNFEAIAREWFEKQKPGWVDRHSITTMQRLEYNVFPYIGTEPIGGITPKFFLDVVLRRIEDRGAIETAHRVKQICGQIFRYAIITGKCERDPTADLKGGLKAHKVKHMAAITKAEGICGLLRAIDGYEGQAVTRYALQLAPLVFVRPGELRGAEWAEIDIKKALWKIPSHKMKMGREHWVPLSKQAVDVFQGVKTITGHGRYVFPSLRTDQRPMSNNTVLGALRRMGYSKEEMTGHGFRAMASTQLHEQGWPSEIIEKQLAHSEKNSVKAAYNHAEHLAERKKMMQSWADFLDMLRKQVNGGK